MELWQGDSLELMRRISDESVDLVIADPPYNVGVQTTVNGRKIKNKWDVIANYDNWMLQWIQESQRVLKPTGVLYFWHNNMPEIARLMTRIQDETELAFVSFCIWDKGDGYRAQSWHNRRPGGKSAPRSWFNICEYLLHYFKGGKTATGMEATGRYTTSIRCIAIYGIISLYHPTTDCTYVKSRLIYWRG